MPETGFDMSTLVQLARTAPPLRHGALGRCGACQLSIESHWENGQWQGCTHAVPDTTFVLVPIVGEFGNGLHRPFGRRAAAPRRQTTTRGHKGRRKAGSKRLGRARYLPVPGAKASPDKPLSDRREKVLAAIKKGGKAGSMTRDIIARSGLPNNSVQEALKWLRQHQFVAAVENTGAAE